MHHTSGMPAPRPVGISRGSTWTPAFYQLLGSLDAQLSSRDSDPIAWHETISDQCFRTRAARQNHLGNLLKRCLCLTPTEPFTLAWRKADGCFMGVVAVVVVI